MSARVLVGFACILGSCLCARAGASDAPTAGPQVEIPTGIPVALDGRAEPGEWEDALPVRFSPAAEARVKRHRGTLLLALRLAHPWPRASTLALYARAGAREGSFEEEGAVFLDLEPREHARPHALLRVRKDGAWEPRDGLVVVRASSLDAAPALEAALPLTALGLEGGEPRALRFVLAWMTPGQRPSHSTFPAGLDLSASPGGSPPPDLASVARWASAGPFPDAGGPGAFPRAEWDRLVAEDAELARRGAAAHRLALELLGDAGEGGGAGRNRKDAPVSEGLVDGLRWIAQREALTGRDARALAVGLWRTNRTAEALAWLEARIAAAAPGAADTDDVRLAADIAMDAERFGDAARWYAAAAARLGDRVGAPFARLAESARRTEALAREEEADRARRAQDPAAPRLLVRTAKGDFVVRLHPDESPKAVAQWLALVGRPEGADARGFYAGTRFHWVLAPGLARGGDPTSRGDGCATAGEGGSDASVEAEPGKWPRFWRGSVGLAPSADGRVRSQFFVCTAPRFEAALRGAPRVGTVTGGMDVVDRLEACDEILGVEVLGGREAAGGAGAAGTR